MTDSLDKKSKEKRDKLDVDLDAMLDEAKSSLPSMNEFSDDEDAIDRLLMNAGFDADDSLMQTELNKDVNIVKDLDMHDLSSFDGFGEDFNEPETSPQTAEVEDGGAGLTEENSSLTSLSESQDDEDAIERLLMTAGFEANDAPEQANVEEAISALDELDDFSDFSDFNESETIPAVNFNESESATGNLSPVVTDETNDFSGLGDDFDELNMIQDDQSEVSSPAEADLIPLAVDDESDVEVDAELDDFSDFSDFNEPETVRQESPGTTADEVDESERITAPPSDDVDLSDEVDDFSKQIEDQLAEAEKLSTQANLVAADVEAQAVLSDDEDTVDSLFLDADFDAEDALEQAVGKKDELDDDTDLNEIDDFFQLDEVSDDFSTQIDEQLVEAENLSTQDSQEDDFLLPDFDITADMDISDLGSDAGIKEDELTDAFGNTDFLDEENALPTFEPEAEGGNEAIVEPVPSQTLAPDTVKEDVESAKLSFEQEDIKKQLEEANKKVKKAKLLAYVALGFGAVAASAAVGLGVMTYGAKTEVAKLTEDVSTLEASLAKIAANNPNEEINAMMSSVVQLNQQVYGFITELKGNPQFPVDLLDNKVPDIVAKQEMVSKALAMLEVKVGGLEGKVSSEPPVAEPTKVEAAHQSAPAKEEHAHELAPVKTNDAHAPIKAGVTHESEPAKPSLAKKEPAHESVPTKEGTAHEIAPSKVEANHGTAPAKVDAVPKTTVAKVEAVTKNTPVKVVAVPEAAKVIAPPEAVTPKPIIPQKAVVKQEPVKPKKSETAAIWGVNLVAFKQEWFAKSKAAEFARQGVYAEVIPVPGNMYRLRVGGFKSKAEANANKDRIKRALNLDSVWVSDN